MRHVLNPVVFLTDTFKTPPFTLEGRIEAGTLLRMLQLGQTLSMPISRPMSSSIGRRYHELRVRDGEHNWRIVYRLDPDAVIVVDVFPKKTGKTPATVIKRCKQRLAEYDQLIGD